MLFLSLQLCPAHQPGHGPLPQRLSKRLTLGLRCARTIHLPTVHSTALMLPRLARGCSLRGRAGPGPSALQTWRSPFSIPAPPALSRVHPALSLPRRAALEPTLAKGIQMTQAWDLEAAILFQPGSGALGCHSQLRMWAMTRQWPSPLHPLPYFRGARVGRCKGWEP